MLCTFKVHIRQLYILPDGTFFQHKTHRFIDYEEIVLFFIITSIPTAIKRRNH